MELWKRCIILGMPAPATPREKILHPATAALDLATIMRTLGDPVRLEIVRLLADGRPRACGELSTGSACRHRRAPTTCACCARRA